MTKARHNITLTDTWAATLGVHCTLIGHPQAVGVGSIGGGAVMQWQDFIGVPRPQQHAPDDPPPPDWPEGVPGVWCGGWYQYELTLDSSLQTVSTSRWLYAGDFYDLAPQIDDWNPTDPVLSVGDWEVPITFTLSGVYLKGEAVPLPTTDRQPMDYTDFVADYSWYADENAQVTVAGGGIELSLPLVTRGQEIELGNDFRLVYGLACPERVPSGVTYARISDISFNGITPDLAGFDLYNPGSGPVPDSAQPNWTRAEDEAHPNRWRVSNDGGLAMWHEGADAGPLESSVWTGWTMLPVSVTFRAKTNPFLDRVGDGYKSTPPRFTSPVLEWSLVDGVWTSARKEFTDTISAIESRCSWQWQREWQKLDTTSATVEVSRAWQRETGRALGA